MAKHNFEKVMVEIFKHEGGYVDHPRDPGGATNMGITHRTLAAFKGRSVTKGEVRNLTKPEARDIYRLNYWSKVRGDDLPPGFDLVAMDGGVNSGPSRGIKWLQKGVGAKADGVIGPDTLAKVGSSTAAGIKNACAARMSFLRALSHWGAFGRGWSRRVASVEAVGVRMWVEAVASPQAARGVLEANVSLASDRATEARRNSVAQPAAAGGGGVGGAAVVDLPPTVIVALALGVAVTVALLWARSRMRARYHEDQKWAYMNEIARKAEEA